MTKTSLMAALVLASAGARVLFLGTEVPLPQLASLARDLNARGVAVSVSEATRGNATTAQSSHERCAESRGRLEGCRPSTSYSNRRSSCPMTSAAS